MKATETFVVFDFDRCLGNDALYDLLDEVIATMPEFDNYALAVVRKQVEDEGGSFDTLGWLERQAHVSDAALEELSEKYIRRANERGSQTYLADGAKEILAYLDHTSVPYMIMTFGGKRYQSLKLRAAGLEHIPHVVVSSKEKAGYIAQWWNDESGVFQPPIGATASVKNVILVDDKPAAFIGLPAHASGYLVTSGAVQLESQLGRLPPRVTRCDSLDEVLEGIRAGYKQSLS